MLKELPLRVLFFMLCTFAVFMAMTPRPPHLDLNDKVQHMMAFGTLAIVARLGFPRARDLTILERLSFGGALIEVFQAIPELHRDCDWHDWVADTLAITIALLIMRLLPWRKLVASAD
jgi:hypothetical protein